MTHLLDTNICSYHMRRPGGLAHRFFQHSGQIALPTIVLAELYTGAHKRSDPTRLLAIIDDLLQEMHVLDFDLKCAQRFGIERGKLLQRGMSVPIIDLMIASIALVHDLTVVTHNTVDFKNIPGLRLEDWMES